MIRVHIVDDHPTGRAGLDALLRREPGIVPDGTSGSAEDALAQVRAHAADVVLADDHLPEHNGLLLGWELKQLQARPRVVIFSAFAEPQLSLAAALTGVEAVLDKSSPVEAIFETIRAVAEGKNLIGPIPRMSCRPAHRSSTPRTTLYSASRSPASRPRKSLQCSAWTRTS